MIVAAREKADLAASLDSCTAEILECLALGGMFGSRSPRFSPAAYRALAERTEREFSIPRTSVTTAAARLLFGISETARPKRMLVAGSYYGNSLVWLVGPAIGYAKPGSFDWIVGCDTDPEACAGASANLAPFANSRILINCQDARQFVKESEGGIDLLLLDVDDPRARKSLYAELLLLALPKLAPGALVLAHDRYEPLFQADFEPYLEIVRDQSLFDISVGVPIDAAGFEISRRAGLCVR